MSFQKDVDEKIEEAIARENSTIFLGKESLLIWMPILPRLNIFIGLATA
jgi:hypothetical protein